MSAPYRCPVCEGRGNVPKGFYDRMTSATDLTPETCRSCHGQGIVWSREAAHVAPYQPPLPEPTRYFINGCEIPPPPEYEIVCDRNSCVMREKKR